MNVTRWLSNSLLNSSPFSTAFAPYSEREKMKIVFEESFLGEYVICAKLGFW